MATDSPLARRALKSICRAKGDDEEPDWEKEMSIFAKRLSAPNQLATLRELESKVNVGKVRRARLERLNEAVPRPRRALEHRSACVLLAERCAATVGDREEEEAPGRGDACPSQQPNAHSSGLGAQVLFVRDSLAIVSGLNADAPVGTKLSFVTGGTGCAQAPAPGSSSAVMLPAAPELS